MKKLIGIFALFMVSCTDITPSTRVVSSSTNDNYKVESLGSVNGYCIYKISVDSSVVLFAVGSGSSMTKLK